MKTEATLAFAEMFAALGSPQRLDIVRLLIQSGERGMAAGEIQEKLDIPNSTLSHHLEKLRQEGLIDVRRDRQWMWHTVNLEAVGKLIAFLCARCYKPAMVDPLLHRIRKECEK